MTRLRRIAIAAAAFYVLLAAAANYMMREMAERVFPDRMPAPAAGVEPVAAVAADGVRLEAWLYRPASPNGDAVIALHGVGASRRALAAHARMLASHGYTVLTPDSRGHGTSGGAVVTFGLLERNDVRLWVESLAPRRVYGLGQSVGAAILLQALPLAPLRAAVAEAPYATFEEIAYDRLDRAGMNGWMPWPMLEPAFLAVRWQHRLNFKEASPLEALRHTRTPVLLIAGAADTNVPPRHSRKLHAAFPGQTELWELPDVRHTQAYRQHPAEFEQRVVEWFRKH